MALLVDPDDAEREYTYESKTGIFEIDEPIKMTAARLGWTVAGTAFDWSVEFADELDQRH